MSSKEWRYALAVVIGVLFDALFFWKFQPYASREHGHDLLAWYFEPVLAFAAGLLLTMGIEGKKRFVLLIIAIILLQFVERIVLQALI